MIFRQNFIYGADTSRYKRGSDSYWEDKMEETKSVMYMGKSPAGEGLGYFDMIVRTENHLGKSTALGIPFPKGFEAKVAFEYDPSTPKVPAGAIGSFPKPKTNGDRFLTFTNHNIGDLTKENTSQIVVYLGKDGRYEMVVQKKKGVTQEVGKYRQQGDKLVLEDIARRKATRIFEQLSIVNRVLWYAITGDTDSFPRN